MDKTEFAKTGWTNAVSDKCSFVLTLRNLATFVVPRN
jgi:hypothetical protein